MKPWRAALAALAVVLAGCVDHQLNARQFCDEHQDLLSAEIDNAQLALSNDDLNDVEDDIEKTMRDAEDGTRPVRLAARDLVDAYDELAGIVDDDDADEEERADAREELRKARAETRDACAKVKRD